MILMLLLVLAGSSTVFITFMNQQQARAGARLRAAAAMRLAEAGVHRALAILESTSPDGTSPGRAWRPSAHTEAVSVGLLAGEFTFSLADDPGGAISLTSIGEIGGTARRIRARVHLASAALLSALYGTGFVRLERPPAALFIVPYGQGVSGRPWVHIAAGRGIWFATSQVSINASDRRLEATSGPVDPLAGAGSPTLPRPGPARVLLARRAELTVGRDTDRVDLQQLQAMGVYLDATVSRVETLPPAPEWDRAYYQALAAANTGNAGLNEAAGTYFGNHALARKHDSLYLAGQFDQLLAYLQAGLQQPRLRGVIYVRSWVTLPKGQRLRIDDGTLMAERSIFLVQEARLEIRHTPATRTLPGVVALEGPLIVMQGARLAVHGLVYANQTIDVGADASVDAVGAVLGNDPTLSFRNSAASVVIRYDPAVLGTLGLHVPRDAPHLAWVAAWEELP